MKGLNSRPKDVIQGRPGASSPVDGVAANPSKIGHEARDRQAQSQRQTTRGKSWEMRKGN